MKRKIGGGSIKESFDNLPSGICFADRHGVIVLCNRQMHRLCHTLMGTDLQNILELRAALQNPQPGISAANYPAHVFRFPDGQIWEFSESTVTDALGRSYTQMQAFHVTELYEKKSELEKENRMLKEVNRRARRLYSQLDQTVREEETFALKMRVHNDIGLRLLATQQALTQNVTLDELREVGKMWRRTIHAFGITDALPYDGPQTGLNAPILPGEALHELISSVAGIGVKLTLSGSLPQDDKLAYLLLTAMRECATNTVRHAHGNEMTVTLMETDASVSAQIINNGRQPDVEIAEGGGLSNLRRRVEMAGGAMHITSRPEYRLTLTLPRKEEKP